MSTVRRSINQAIAAFRRSSNRIRTYQFPNLAITVQRSYRNATIRVGNHILITIAQGENPCAS